MFELCPKAAADYIINQRYTLLPNVVNLQI